MRHDIDLAISKPLWWTQNRRSRSWAVPYRRKKLVKTMSLLTFRNLINSGKLQKPEHWPVHVTAIIHPLTHGRFDPENAAPMVKAILDGITQSGYWPDDNADYVLGPDYRLGEPSTEKGVYHIKSFRRFDPRSREPISKKLRKAVYERDHYRCVECGATDHLSLDHIIPWSLGGEDTMENLQTMCRSCNSRKGNRLDVVQGG